MEVDLPDRWRKYACGLRGHCQRLVNRSQPWEGLETCSSRRPRREANALSWSAAGARYNPAAQNLNPKPAPETLHHGPETRTPKSQHQEPQTSADQACGRSEAGKGKAECLLLAALPPTCGCTLGLYLASSEPTGRQREGDGPLPPLLSLTPLPPFPATRPCPGFECCRGIAMVTARRLRHLGWKLGKRTEAGWRLSDGCVTFNISHPPLARSPIKSNLTKWGLLTSFDLKPPSGQANLLGWA